MKKNDTSAKYPESSHWYHRSALRLCIALALAGNALVAWAADPGTDSQSSPPAQFIHQLLPQTKVDAMVGLINFSYLNHGHSQEDTHANAVGGHVYIHSPQWYGLSVGVAANFATWTGFYLHNDPELTGPYPSHGMAALRNAYLQAHYGPVVLRGGRLFIQTPYANMDYYTFSPRAFTGIAAVIDVIGGARASQWSGTGPLQLAGSPATLSVFAGRMYSYESRYSPEFTTGNRYSSTHNNGFYVLGARYAGELVGNPFALQAWYYNFYGFSTLFYGQANLRHPLSSGQSLFAGFQVVSQGTSGTGGYLPELNASSVRAEVYGAKLGYAFNDNLDSVALVYNYSPVNYNAFRHGGMLHPYNDLSGTLYTTTMQTGISDYGPGFAYGITSNFSLLARKLQVSASFIRYLVRYGFGGSVYTYQGAYGFPTGEAIPNQNLWSMDVGFSYDLSSLLKGLTVADYTDISVAGNRAGYPHYNNPYFSNRFYFKYHF
ncbi:MAG: hypothetical protein ACP5D5_01050 [Acidithiobacillus sp.]|uniref:hypothetical protein n=1 Tax=Acidithiobacillus sp. TaxID=1872118 RepID=UPI003D085AFC